MPPRKRATPSDIDRREVIDELNRLMAEEVEACLRYFQMRYRLDHADRTSAGTLFDEAIRETLEHAAAIAARITVLGHVPALRVNLTLGGGPARLDAVLAEAIDVEQQALDAYTDLLPRVSGEPDLADFVRQQIDVEAEHVEQMRAVARSRAGMTLVRGRQSDTPPSR